MTYQERVALIEELREYIQEHGVQPGVSPYYGEGYHREDVIAIAVDASVPSASYRHEELILCRIPLPTYCASHTAAPDLLERFLPVIRRILTAEVRQVFDCGCGAMDSIDEEVVFHEFRQPD